MAIDFLQLAVEYERFPERIAEKPSLSSDPPAFLAGFAPDSAIRACIHHLSEKGDDHLGAQYIPWLAANDQYLAVVLDPEVLSLDSAKRVCRLFRTADPYFFTHLSRLAFSKDNPQPPSFTTRALAILDELSKDDPIVPWLRQLTDHPDESVRSKAVKVLCRLRPSKSIVDLHVKSADPRVRANAIEALWHSPGNEAIPIFKSATKDTHHRVVANALVGLHYRKDPGALAMMINLTDHPSSKFRLAAIWALGAVADRRAIPTLQRLLSDPSEAVREKAKHVLATFGPGPGGNAEQAPRPSRSFSPASSDAGILYRQVA